MNSDRRDQKKAGVIISYITTFANIMVQLVYTPFMLKTLGQSEYGLFTVASGIINYLSLFDLGLAGTYLKFYFDKQKEDEKKVDVLNGTYLKIYVVLSAAAVLSGFFLADNMGAVYSRTLTPKELTEAGKIMKILSISMGLTILSGVWNSVIIAHERFICSKLVALFKVLFSPFIAVPLLYMGYGSVSMAIASLMAAVVSLIYSFLYCVKKIGFECNLRENQSGLLPQMLSFSFFIFLNDIISQINWNVDKLLLGYYQGTIAAAIYGVGSQVDTVYRSLSGNLSSVFAPMVNQLIGQKDSTDREISEIFIKIGRIQYAILFPILEGFLFFGQYFVRMWAGDGYQESYWVALILIVPVTVPLIQNIGIDIQRAKNKHRFRSIIYFIMAVINIAVSIPLCIRWGAIGCAIGTAISFIIANCLIMNWYYARYLLIDISGFWNSIFMLGRGAIAPTIYIVLYAFLVGTNDVIRFTLGIVSYIIIYLVSMMKWGLNERERFYIKQYLTRFRKKQ